MSHQMLTSTLEGVVKHPLFQRDRFGEMGLPRMAQRAVVSHHPRFSEATCPIPTRPTVHAACLLQHTDSAMLRHSLMMSGPLKLVFATRWTLMAGSPVINWWLLVSLWTVDRLCLPITGIQTSFGGSYLNHFVTWFTLGAASSKSSTRSSLRSSS